MNGIRESAHGLTIEIKVIPRSKKSAAVWNGSILKLKITAPPVDGKANEAVIKTLAEILDIPMRDIEIIRGEKNTHKTISMKNITQNDLESLLGHLKTY